ncbi:MAG: 16S rRNA (cytosine(1402)-N(4))-methyltransferase, partial [candidate division WWE3 bacterium]|nr:16S rRNA (cytosine(1402)-N(4))-methyltransferase [candidate division WWE3 bacterium]
RLDPRLMVTAADLINGLPEKGLYDIFKEYGEEPGAYRFAKFACRARLLKPIKSTADLLLALELNGLNNRGRIHPATKVFQALRIAVNGELENLKIVLPIVASKLAKGGRLVVISFHSLEDRIVKNFGKSELSLKEVNAVVSASLLEINSNPRSRSAKMRVYEKI